MLVILYTLNLFVGLVLETVDNSSGGFNNGAITYNLYAELDGGLITFIFADESNPLEINTSTSFIDNQFGADIQGLVNDAFFALFLLQHMILGLLLEILTVLLLRLLLA